MMAIAEAVERSPREHVDDGHRSGGQEPVSPITSVMASR
jgi:hypothetical protein